MNIAGLHCCMCLCKKFHLSANELGIGGGGGVLLPSLYRHLSLRFDCDF